MAVRGAEANRTYRLSLTYPIWVPLALLATAMVFRIVDILLLPLAEATGEAFLHKALGFLLVLGYLWAAGRERRSSCCSALGCSGSSLAPQGSSPSW